MAAMSLETAVQSLPSDPAAATEALIEAWREHPVAELVLLAGRASRLAAADREKITGIKKGELHAAWLHIEKAKDPLDVDRLLETLTVGTCAEAKVRLGLITQRPADPRIVDALVGIVTIDGKGSSLASAAMRGSTQAEIPYTSAPNRTFWTALAKWLEEHANATSIEVLKAAPGRKRANDFGEWLDARLDRLIPKIAARPVSPATADEETQLELVDALLARLEAAAQQRQINSDALFADVWKNPDDDGPREVLADLLTQKGDPRGEFIALQMARHRGTLDAAGKKREKELLKRHKKEWLGPIAPLIQPHHIRFERGFIVTCSLEPDAALEKSLGTHRAWSTIREFLVHGYAAQTGRTMAKMLTDRGAVRISSGFTRGIE